MTNQSTRNSKRNARRFALFAASLFMLSVPMGTGSEPVPTGMDWLLQADDPAALQDALAENADRIPPEFYDRLEHITPSGHLRVMVALAERTPAVEAAVASGTSDIHWYYDSTDFLAAVTPDELLGLLEDPNVRFIEPDYPLTYFMSEATVDTNVRSVFSGGSGAGTGVWTYNTSSKELESDHPDFSDAVTGQGTTIAMIDSGIDDTHDDFSGWDCADTEAYSNCDSRVKAKVVTDHVLVDTGMQPGGNLPTSEAASGHGTHVAGIAAGNAYVGRIHNYNGGGSTDGLHFGVAPEASLISVKNGDTLWAGLSTDALWWTHTYADFFGINVSSNSWGCVDGCAYNHGSSTNNAIKALYNKDVVVTFAVGNEGGNGGGGEFSGYAQSPWAIAVAAYNDVSDQVARFSSRGDESTSNTLPTPETWTPGSEASGGYTDARRPDVAAPGVGILAPRTLTGGAASLAPRAFAKDVDPTFPLPAGIPYVGMDGTSMATPIVAGIAALLFDACPGASALDVMRAIYVGADDNPSTLRKTSSSTAAEPFEVGYGKVDAAASLAWLDDELGC